MSYTAFCPQSPSYTAMKYLREYIPHRAMLPGERYRLHLDMEAKVGNKSPCQMENNYVLYNNTNSVKVAMLSQ